MKERIFASELSDKKVVDTSGSEIGMLDHLRLDAVTGDLTSLMVRPSPHVAVTEFETSGQLIVLPFAAVKAVRDVIVVDSARLVTARAAPAAIAEATSGSERGLRKPKAEPEREVSKAKTPPGRAEPGVRRAVSRTMEQPAPEAARSAREELREPQEPAIARSTWPAARPEKRGARSEAGARRVVSRAKEQAAPGEERPELEAEPHRVSETIEQGASEAELHKPPSNDWAQRRLMRGMQPPAFDHPAFRRPGSSKRAETGNSQSEPPKDEEQ